MLTEAEITWLAQQLRTLPGGWTLDRVDAPGDLSAVLLPVGGDHAAPSFLLDRTRDGVRIISVRWDVSSAPMVYPSVADAFAEVLATAATGLPAAAFPNLQ